MAYSVCKHYAQYRGYIDMASTTTRTICGRLSKEQYQIVRDILGRETDSDYIRRLIAHDLQKRGIEWPGYKIVSNEDRSRLKIRGRGA